MVPYSLMAMKLKKSWVWMMKEPHRPERQLWGQCAYPNFVWWWLLDSKHLLLSFLWDVTIDSTYIELSRDIALWCFKFGSADLLKQAQKKNFVTVPVVETFHSYVPCIVSHKLISFLYIKTQNAIADSKGSLLLIKVALICK